jgi:phosphoserine phosphatase
MTLRSRPHQIGVVGLVGFDLDGTLLRHRTVCEILAEPLGRMSEMQRIEALSEEAEIAAARREMAGWYSGFSVEQLTRHLDSACWAPGACEAVGRLQKAGAVVAIASYTWSFAVHWFAEQLNVAHHLGSELMPNGGIVDVWGRDKAAWLMGLAEMYGLPRTRTAAIGDSRGDKEMLMAVGLPFFVGRELLSGFDRLEHKPEADLRDIADQILDVWSRDVSYNAP